MRIAQVCPLWERVPPPGYGGVELVVSQITDELVRRGHEVTLFASGDSQTLAKLESVIPEPIRLDPSVKEPLTYELLQLGKVVERAKEFDIIHFHMEMIPLLLVHQLKTPVVHTLHGPFSKERNKLFERYSDQPYISISNAQRQAGPPKLNYISTVYNGIDVNDYPFQAQPQNPPYLAFLSRMSPEKGPHHAVTIAKETGWPLKMAGKIDPQDRKFFEQEIAPYVDGKQIEYLGELKHQEKVQLFANASATLFPITWPEPFGLVMIESMCTGTPVIGMKMASVPEVVAHQKTGFVCSSIEEMITAIPEAVNLDRQYCREYVEQFFSTTKMVDDYEAAYRQILEQQRSRRSSSLPVIVA